MRVLIADDQKSVGTSLAELVRRCQHEVVEVVGSGLEAIQAFARHHPDVVLMDYEMPKLNGATACRNIVAKYPDARVILVSGSPREIGGSGARAVLMKPIKLDTLYAALYDASKPSPRLQRVSSCPRILLESGAGSFRAARRYSRSTSASRRGTTGSC